MQFSEVFTIFASGIAVAVSVFSVAIAYSTSRRDRPSLKPAVSFWLPTTEVHDLMVALEVQNDGRYPEVVNTVGYKARDGRSIQLYQPQYFPGGVPPRRLDAGDSLQALISAVELYRTWNGMSVRRATAYVGTKSGRSYSEPMPSDLRRFLRTGELKKVGGGYARLKGTEGQG